MLSRVADSIYWMARQVERAESVARFIDVNLQLNIDMPEESPTQWESLIYTTGDHEEFFKRHKTANRETVIEFLTFDRQNTNSILSCVRFARENCRSVREIVSSEMWFQLNTFYLMLMASDARQRAMESPDEFFNAIRTASHLFNGLTYGTMSHGEAWHFARMGAMLERADKATRILDVKYYLLLPESTDVGSTIDDIQWSAVLKSCSGFEMYRKRHHRILPDRVVDFLLLDREFPRAVHHCVQKADESLHAITGTAAGSFRNPVEKQLGQLRAELAYAQVNEVLKDGLHEFLDALQTQLNLIGDGIFETFFSRPPYVGVV